MTVRGRGDIPYLLAGPERNYQGLYAIKVGKGETASDFFALCITMFRNVQRARDRFSLQDSSNSQRGALQRVVQPFGR
jgi:hypothetical protein